MVYKLLDGELLRRDEFEKIVHYPWKHAIFQTLLGVSIRVDILAFYAILHWYDRDR